MLSLKHLKLNDSMKHNFAYRYIIYIVAIVLLSACYPIRRVGLLQEREGLPEYEKGEYEQYYLQKNDELELRVISLNPETASRIVSTKMALSTSLS